MCGIAGYLNFDGKPASPVILKAMTDMLVHRGPDDEGQLVEGGLGLGHRRLSIIDLYPTGHQPMASSGGHLVISFNGEIYNYRELRLELETLGYSFRSESDTEVLLSALEAWGEKALLRLNGMFAFVLYDRRERCLLLARDRYGIKPLYYVTVGQTVMFASEIKAFIAHPAFKADLNPDGLIEYMSFQNFLTDRTLYKNVHILPAGNVLSIAMQGPVRAPRQYWDFQFSERETGRTRADYLEELDNLFVQAVSRQLVSDVPVASYLSGGLDTGAIAVIASRQLPEMRTFTIGFDMSSVSGLELAFDERAKAERMSALCRTEQYEMVLKAGDMERAIDPLVWHLEEPRVGQSYPNFYAAKLAGKFNKVVLSGAGGDELFAGYPWRYFRASDNHDFNDYSALYFKDWQRLVPSDAFPALTAPLDGKHQTDPLAVFRSVFAHHATELARPEDYICHSLYFEAKTFLHGLLVVEDKLSMAHSLESRVPFLDNNLVDFAMALPVSHKLANLGQVAGHDENLPGPKTSVYSQRSQDGKVILREAMARYVPADVASGAKQGFSAPDASWFRGESIDYVRRVLVDRRSRLYDYLDYDVVCRLVADHLEGRANRRLLIWSLIYLESWCRQFLSGSGWSATQQRARAALR
ncbi:asparagine synthase (glutamine-hydrolyzing) [Bradyrhizobium sp. CSA112]|uniref:asparagine synthase (glutamine-hydrolyzing) n=1 Tax=Bradyrhizobium sp. CSA112 TaxID=2699170 RepID=UPI0023B009BD|nr:asparagine synthase (glutamine-hydrolyzing) [Bradyrhizobium sp. CSA112]MDE5453008.1 asparagine synthase (glutamine-hydrolyzing) [Bradyrhizobium sp. CSA112]